MNSFSGITVVVVEINAGGKTEEIKGFLIATQLLGKDRMDRWGKRGFMDATRLIIEVIDKFFSLRKRLVVQEHEHQHVRLFDHVITIDAIV